MRRGPEDEGDLRDDRPRALAGSAPGGRFNRRTGPDVEGLSHEDMDRAGLFSLPPIPFLVADACWVPLGLAALWLASRSDDWAYLYQSVEGILGAGGLGLWLFWPFGVSAVQWWHRRRTRRRDLRAFELWRLGMVLVAVYLSHMWYLGAKDIRRDEHRFRDLYRGTIAPGAATAAVSRAPPRAAPTGSGESSR